MEGTAAVAVRLLTTAAGIADAWLLTSRTWKLGTTCFSREMPLFFLCMNRARVYTRIIFFGGAAKVCAGERVATRGELEETTHRELGPHRVN